MYITVIGEVFNQSTRATGNGCNAQISINDNTTKVKYNIIGGGAKGADGLGADPEFIQQTEQRLTELEGDPKHEWNAIQW